MRSLIEVHLHLHPCAQQVLSGMSRLSEADRKIVTTGGVFFSSLIKAGACIDDVAAAIAALCVDNEEFSTIIARTIVGGLETGAWPGLVRLACVCGVWGGSRVAHDCCQAKAWSLASQTLTE